MTGNEGKLAYFGGMDRVRFRKPVHPGDTLVTEVELIATKGNIGKIRAVARIDDEVAAEGEFMFALVDRDARTVLADDVVGNGNNEGSGE
jgi:3-hydroxymyristoyl/3-hydroxydecanoyl-(acyl carrier protein) dehydratase